MKIASLIQQLEAWMPLWLAESWDASGLQAGNPESNTEGVLLCLDVTESALDEAHEYGINLILSHHPMLFTPLKSLDVRSGTGRLLQKCLSLGLTVYSLHTNLDKASGGMNDYVAECLGLKHLSALTSSPVDNQWYKLVTFVPDEHREEVLEALFTAGGGKIGAYEGCSFGCKGQGTFFAGKGTSPVTGGKGIWNQVPEIRIEVLFPAVNIERGVTALLAAHPYEVPAYDIYPLRSFSTKEGFGRVGSLSPPLAWEAFLARIQDTLKVDSFRIVGPPVAEVSRVALCTGSGASFIPQAARRAQVYITGDVKFHEAQDAVKLGLTVIDAGHFALERIFVDLMDRWFERKGLKSRLRTHKCRGDKDPFIFIYKGENL